MTTPTGTETQLSELLSITPDAHLNLGKIVFQRNVAISRPP